MICCEYQLKGHGKFEFPVPFCVSGRNKSEDYLLPQAADRSYDTFDATLYFILNASFLTHTSISLILNVTLPESGDDAPDFGAFVQHRNRRRTLT